MSLRLTAHWHRILKEDMYELRVRRWPYQRAIADVMYIEEQGWWQATLYTTGAGRVFPRLKSKREAMWVVERELGVKRT